MTQSIAVSDSRPHYIEYRLTPEGLKVKLSSLPKKPDFSGSEFTAKTLRQARQPKPKKPKPPKISKPKVAICKPRKSPMPERIKNLRQQGWVTRHQLRGILGRKWNVVQDIMRELQQTHKHMCLQHGTGWYYHPDLIPLAQQASTLRPSPAPLNIVLGRQMRRIPPRADFKLLVDVVVERGWPRESVQEYCKRCNVGVLKGGLRFLSPDDIKHLEQWRKTIKGKK